MWEVVQTVVLFVSVVCVLIFVFGRSYATPQTETLHAKHKDVVKAKNSPREPEEPAPLVERKSSDDTLEPQTDSPSAPEVDACQTTFIEDEIGNKQPEAESNNLMASSVGGSTVTRRKIDRATLLRNRTSPSVDAIQAPNLLEKIKSLGTSPKIRPSSGDVSQNKFARLRTQSCPDPGPLETSSNRWVPTRSGLQPLEQSMKQAKGVLNKLTPENFESLSAKVCALDVCGGALSSEFAQLLLETAIVYPLHGTTYAQLAVVLGREWSNEENPESDFRTQLLSKCQSFFVERSTSSDSQHRKRVMNAVRFIGALFCNRVIPPTIVTMCIRELLDGSRESLEEQEIEALCTLLAAVGQKLDNEGHQPFIAKCVAEMIDMSRQSLPSRLRFLLLDTLDLRSNQWRPRRKQDVPQKLDNLRKEMEKSMHQPTLRSTQRQSTDGFQQRPSRPRTSSGFDDFMAPTLLRKNTLDSSDRSPKLRSPNTPDGPSPLSSPVFAPIHSRSAPTHTLPAPSSPLPTLHLPAQSALAAPRSADLPPSMASLPALASSLELQSKLRMSMEDDSPTLIPIISPSITPPSSPTRQTPKERIQNLLRMFFLTQSHQHVISEMTSDTALRNSIGNFIAKGVSMSFDLGQSDRVRFVELIQNLVNSGLATASNVTQALQAATADLEDLVLDVPHSPKLAAFYLSQCFVNNQISAQDLIGIFQTIQKHSGGIAEQVSTEVIASIKEHKGLVGVQEFLQQLEQSSPQSVM